MALRRSPEDAELKALVGDNYFESGELENATSTFIEALTLDPENLRALKGLAYAYHSASNPDTTYAYLKYLERKPEDADVLYNFGNYLTFLGDHEEAIRQYSKAEVIVPTNALIKEMKGRSLSAIGNLEEAISSFREASKSDPEKLDYYLLLSSAYRTLGRADDAVEILNAALEHHKENPYVHLELSYLLINAGDFEKADGHCDRAMSALPPDETEYTARAHSYKGWIHYKLGRFSEAVEANETALGYVEPMYWVYFNLALAKIFAGRSEESREDYQKGIELLQNWQELQEDAIDDLQEALEKDPDVEGGRETLRFLEETRISMLETDFPDNPISAAP